MNNLRLSIQEIADLKEGRKTLEEIEKTHDGTSMGKIGPVLDKWIEEGHLVSCAGFDENGKKIYQTTAINDKSGPTLLKEEIDGNVKDIHCISSNFWDENGKPAAKIRLNETEFHMPGAEQLYSITMKNDNDEYLLRSFSFVSMDHTRFTVLRNNNFSEADHKAFKEVSQDIDKQSKSYAKGFDKAVEAKMEEIRRSGNVPVGPEMALIIQAKKEVIKEYPSWQEAVYDKNNFGERFEQCNTKFRTKKVEVKYEEDTTTPEEAMEENIEH